MKTTLRPLVVFAVVAGLIALGAQFTVTPGRPISHVAVGGGAQAASSAGRRQTCRLQRRHWSRGRCRLGRWRLGRAAWIVAAWVTAAGPVGQHRAGRQGARSCGGPVDGETP